MTLVPIESEGVVGVIALRGVVEMVAFDTEDELVRKVGSSRLCLLILCSVGRFDSADSDFFSLDASLTGRGSAGVACGGDDAEKLRLLAPLECFPYVLEVLPARRRDLVDSDMSLSLRWLSRDRLCASAARADSNCNLTISIHANVYSAIMLTLR